jgi:hypothetical protein
MAAVECAEDFACWLQDVSDGGSPSFSSKTPDCILTAWTKVSTMLIMRIEAC